MADFFCDRCEKPFPAEGTEPDQSDEAHCWREYGGDCEPADPYARIAELEAENKQLRREATPNRWWWACRSDDGDLVVTPVANLESVDLADSIVDWLRAVRDWAATERLRLDLDEARAEAKRLGRGIVANAGQRSPQSLPRWAHVMYAVGLGSTSARALCAAHGFDPDEDVGGHGSEDPDEDDEVSRG